MSASMRRALFWTVLFALLLAGLTAAFWPRAVPVDMAEARVAPLLVSVDAEGRTRVHDVFTLSAPVAGRIPRIDLDVGDEVTASETEVTRIEPVDPAFLDVRTEAQAKAAVSAAEAALRLAEAELERSEADLDFAEGDLERLKTLYAREAVSKRALDEAERRFKAEKAAVATAQAAVQVKSFELEQARAALMPPSEARANASGCDCIPVHSPVSGHVLKVIRESAGIVQAGDPLIEIGELGTLEIVTDVLSSDAVKVEPGQRVIIEEWGGSDPLEGTVRRVEPFGFTEVSALGVEEQRVNILIDFVAPPEKWKRLGHGYRVETRIVLSEGDALQVPLGALFRSGGDWALFVVKDGEAELRTVEVGRRNDLSAEVISGLREDDRVILNPGDRVSSGAAVIKRTVE